MLQIAPRRGTTRPAHPTRTAHPAHRKRPLIRLADRIFGQVLCITREKVETILAVLGPRLGLDTSILPIVSVDPDAFDDDNDPQYEITDGGIAVIPIFGTLVKRSSGMDARSGLTSYEALSQQVTSAVSDPEVRAVLLQTDSPGGESDGMLEASDLIYNLRGAKPMVSLADGQMCSAAYCVASAADHVLITRTGVIGSIGAFALHLDQSERDRAEGLRYTYIQAGARKTDGNPHEPLSNRAQSDLQTEVTRVRDLFAATVARNRGTSAQAFLDTEAGVFYGMGGVPLFADRLGTVDQALELLSASLPARPSYSVPATVAAARQPRGLISAPASLLSSEAAAWLSTHSNLKPHAALAGIIDRLRAELPAMQAKHGPNVEARLIATTGARAAVVSSSDSSRKVTLLLAPYDGSSANLGPFKEIYRPGCFKYGLGGDLRVMFNHADSSQYILGRTSAGTARFWEDAAGLHAEAIAPETSWADDLLVSMRRGDITQSSAAFWIIKQSWEMRNGERYRIVEEAICHDGSVETFPAYEGTSAVATPASTATLSLAADRAQLRSLDSRLPEIERCKAEVQVLKLQ